MDKKKSLPPVSCFCITYKRSHLLEEMIECFLRQDYEGTKELIILNDDEEQTLVFDHPEVKMVNVRERYTTIGDKRNAAVHMCSHNLIMPWDDDDLYLPHKISYSVEKLLFYNVEYYNLNYAFFYSQQGGIKSISKNMFHANSIYSLRSFLKIKGYPSLNQGEDASFVKKFYQQGIPILEEKNTINPKDYFNLYFFYRWDGIAGHISGYGKTSNLNQNITKDRAKQDSRVGVIQLHPNWQHNYVLMAQNFLQKNIK